MKSGILSLFHGKDVYSLHMVWMYLCSHYWSLLPHLHHWQLLRTSLPFLANASTPASLLDPQVRKYNWNCEYRKVPHYPSTPEQGPSTSYWQWTVSGNRQEQSNKGLTYSLRSTTTLLSPVQVSRLWGAALAQLNMPCSLILLQTLILRHNHPTQLALHLNEHKIEQLFGIEDPISANKVY